MYNNEIYKKYRDQIGMPGDSTRALTREYVRLKSTNSLDEKDLCEDLLSIRLMMYESMGMEVKESLINDILQVADGYFPFIIFADIFISNHNNLIDNLDGIIDTLDIVIEVIKDEFNKLVNENDKIEDTKMLETKAKILIKQKTGISI